MLASFINWMIITGFLILVLIIIPSAPEEDHVPKEQNWVD